MPGAVLPAELAVRGRRRYGTICPRPCSRRCSKKKIEFYVIDGYKVAREAGMGTRINTIMQTCFFAISGVLPREEAIAQIKKAIEKTYGKRGEAVVARRTLPRWITRWRICTKWSCPATASSDFDLIPAISSQAPEFVRDVLGQIAGGPRRSAAGQRHAGRRHVSDRHGAVGEAQYRAVHSGVGQGAVHPVRQVRDGLPARGDSRQGLRARSWATRRPATFKWAKPKWKAMEQQRYTLQVAPEDCTGCARVRGSLPGEEQERRQP